MRAGVEDRLRAAAFAEAQAHRAFLWAAERFPEASSELREAWRTLAAEEKRHCELILRRMEALGLDVGARAVSQALWDSLCACKTLEEFRLFMRRSEERGREAELRFSELFAREDPETAALFAEIAADEERHILTAGE